MGLYGVTQMKSEYDPVTYMDALSYQRRYFDALEKYFPDAGERVEIYIGMNESTTIHSLLINILEVHKEMQIQNIASFIS